MRPGGNLNGNAARRRVGTAQNNPRNRAASKDRQTKTRKRRPAQSHSAGLSYTGPSQTGTEERPELSAKVRDAVGETGDPASDAGRKGRERRQLGQRLPEQKPRKEVQKHLRTPSARCGDRCVQDRGIEEKLEWQRMVSIKFFAILWPPQTIRLSVFCPPNIGVFMCHRRKGW